MPNPIKQQDGYLLTWLVVLLAGAAALLPLCDMFFQCGCTWPWAGGVAHCNLLAPKGPHCPWCAAGWRGFVPAGFAMLAGVFTGISIAQRLYAGRWLPELFLAAAGWLTGALVAAWAYAWIFQYPRFVFLQ